LLPNEEPDNPHSNAKQEGHLGNPSL